MRQQQNFQEASWMSLQELSVTNFDLYFRSSGGPDYQHQSLFTASHPQQPWYISLSHGPYDLTYLLY